MPKTTILDRLMQQGRIKPRPNETMWSRADFRDPLNYTFAQRQNIKAHPETFQRFDITPERKVYQRGIDARLDSKKQLADDELYDARLAVEELESEWNDAVEDAKNEMYKDWRNTLDYNDFTDIDLDYLEVETPGTNLEDYWTGRSPQEIYYDYVPAQERQEAAQDECDFIYGPEGRMREQTMTPRYRNYQRAMQQRAANKRMGHQLSRMWGDAYKRLRARGLSDAEARMYLHNYFGGR